MKKLLTTLLFGSFFSACAERQPVPAIPSDPEIEGKIEKLLKGMTLEEKIGQMCDHFCEYFLFLADSEGNIQ